MCSDRSLFAVSKFYRIQWYCLLLLLLLNITIIISVLFVSALLLFIFLFFSLHTHRPRTHTNHTHARAHTHTRTHAHTCIHTDSLFTSLKRSVLEGGIALCVMCTILILMDSLYFQLLTVSLCTHTHTYIRTHTHLNTLSHNLTLTHIHNTNNESYINLE